MEPLEFKINKTIETQFETILINNSLVKMEIDSRSPISFISLEHYKIKFSNIPLQAVTETLRAYNKQTISTKGKN